MFSKPSIGGGFLEETTSILLFNDIPPNYHNFFYKKKNIPTKYVLDIIFFSRINDMEG